MKFVNIKPVERPKDFSKVGFLVKDWEQASKIGEMEVPYITAIEAVRHSKGMYQIVAEEGLAPIEVKVGGLTLDQMDSAQLKLMAVHLGVTMRKTNMKLLQLRALVKAKLDAVEIIDDSADVEGDDDDDDDDEKPPEQE